MKSIWQETARLPQFPKLTNDTKTEVLIVGGGITGILIAYFLNQRGIPYILVEKNKICTGTTGNTTAKITFQHSLIYNKILKSYGLENAQIYLYAHKSAFDKYGEICKNIDCDYEIKDNFVYSIDNKNKLEKEIVSLSKIGYNAKFLDEISLPFENVGAVCFTEQAQFHPLKFLSEISKNLNIYENTFVKDIINNTAITDNCKITANKIILTTHFPFINRHGSYFLKLYQNRSYVIALENAQDVNGMYVDENKNGLSFRNYKDYLIIGGNAHRTGKKNSNWAGLRNFANNKYPNTKEKYFWAAQDCISLDGMAYVGNYSKKTKNLYTASGFNKWGMTGSMLSAMILSDMVTGSENDYSRLFSPSRNIIKPQIFINGFESAKNLLTISNKRCSHLGCALKWNGAEHSWDCACHGSRFTKDGKVIENPANSDLN